jgi:hypothetical protein
MQPISVNWSPGQGYEQFQFRFLGRFEASSARTADIMPFQASVIGIGPKNATVMEYQQGSKMCLTIQLTGISMLMSITVHGEIHQIVVCAFEDHRVHGPSVVHVEVFGPKLLLFAHQVGGDGRRHVRSAASVTACGTAVRNRATVQS